MMIREPGQQMDALGTSKEFVNVDFVPRPTLWDGITRMYIYPLFCVASARCGYDPGRHIRTWRFSRASSLNWTRAQLAMESVIQSSCVASLVMLIVFD